MWGVGSLPTVQRLFSMFPEGGPGVALLLLRISVAGTLIVQAWTYPSVSIGVSIAQWVFPGIVVIALSLAIGFLTPVLSLLSCIAALLALFSSGGTATAVSIASILDASALALLGPGAYSLDAKLFGRRVLTVPPAEASSDR